LFFVSPVSNPGQINSVNQNVPAPISVLGVRV
jgi:hypothetical protein